MRTEHANTRAELSKTSTHATEIETKLQSTTADLTRFKELATKLQDTITATTSELETTTRSLQMEKQNNKELQAMVDALTTKLQRSGKKVEEFDAQFELNKKELSERRLELQNMQQENHSLKLELKQRQNTSATLEHELEMRQRDLQTKTAALMEVKGDMSTLVTDANSEMDTFKLQIEELRSQLKTGAFENSRLAKDKEICEIEMQSIVLNAKMTNKQLEEKKTQLQRREEEMRVLEQDKDTFFSELSDSKREIHSLANLKTRLENDLELKASELEIEHRRVVKVSF